MTDQSLSLSTCTSPSFSICIFIHHPSIHIIHPSHPTVSLYLLSIPFSDSVDVLPTFRYALAHHKPETITAFPPGKTKESCWKRLRKSALSVQAKGKQQHASCKSLKEQKPASSHIHYMCPNAFWRYLSRFSGAQEHACAKGRKNQDVKIQETNSLTWVEAICHTETSRLNQADINWQGAGKKLSNQRYHQSNLGIKQENKHKRDCTQHSQRQSGTKGKLDVA